MSIIYDALKKSQKIRAASKPKIAVAKRPTNTKQNVLLTLLILTCIFTIIMAATMPSGKLMPSLTLSKHSAKTHPTVMPKKVIAAKEPVFIVPKMRLDGVFLSSTEKLAMIDNKSYHLGDEVKGMQLVSISLDKVKLKHKKQVVTLRNELVQ